MTADAIILDNFAHLPVWVGWREEQRNGKKTKVPYSPRTGWEAKSNNAETWATRGEAEIWAIANRGAGVGIVLSRINGGDCCLCGIDLDTCRDPTTETLQDWAQEVVDRFKTYTEISPSGTGVKCFFMHASADTSDIERLFGGKTGKQFKNGGGEHCPAIEIYRTSHYFTVTSESVGPTDIIRQVSLADLEWLILEAGPRFAHKESQKSGSGNDQSRSGKAFRKAPRSRPPAIPMTPCATRCSPTQIRKSPNGRGPRVSPTTSGKCTGFMIMQRRLYHPTSSLPNSPKIALHYASPTATGKISDTLQNGANGSPGPAHIAISKKRFSRHIGPAKSAAPPPQNATSLPSPKQSPNGEPLAP
jgi:hypothetical protein